MLSTAPEASRIPEGEARPDLADFARFHALPVRNSASAVRRSAVTEGTREAIQRQLTRAAPSSAGLIRSYTRQRTLEPGGRV